MRVTDCGLGEMPTGMWRGQLMDDPLASARDLFSFLDWPAAFPAKASAQAPS